MRLISILLCVFGITPLVYADVLVQQDQQDDQPWFHIRIQGQITASDLPTLLDKSSRKGAKQSLFILLDSSGGNLGTVLKMGNFIRSSNAIVMVPQDAVCLSSCIFLLAAGAKRVVVGNVGIHRPFTVQDDIATEQGQKAKYRKIETEVKKYLKKVNIPTELYDEMIRIPPSDMRLLTEGELKRFGLSDDDPYIKEAEVTRQSKRLGITKEEYYKREARINQCTGLSGEEAAQCIQKAIAEPPEK